MRETSLKLYLRTYIHIYVQYKIITLSTWNVSFLLEKDSKSISSEPQYCEYCEKSICIKKLWWFLKKDKNNLEIFIWKSIESTYIKKNYDGFLKKK